MIQHIEKFHLEELSNKAFKNLCRYSAKKGMVAYEMLPSFEDKDFRLKTMQTAQGRILLTLGQLLEFIDERVPDGPYDIKRNASRNAWKFDHKGEELNSSEPVELISAFWNIAKPLFEEGTKIR